MRRSVATTVLCIVPAIVAGAVILAGCEDGPNQTFAPAQGTLFNNGDVDGSVDPVSAALDGGYPGQTALQICTADVKRQRWSQMLNEVIVPPALYGGLDLRGCGATKPSDLDPSVPCEWPGLKIEEAEQHPVAGPDGGLQGGNCQGTASGFGGCAENPNDTCGAVAWGDNFELNFWYDNSTHIIDQLDIALGYTGTMSWQGVNTADPGCGGKAWASAPGQEAQYTLQLGYPILKNNATYQVRWGTGTNQDSDLAELYDSMAKTFYPASGAAWPGCTAQNCQGSGTCLALTNDGAGTGIFGVRPVGTYIEFHSTVPQPAASIPFGIYIDYVKFVPNSTQDMWLALSQQGPFTNSVIPNATGVTSAGGVCAQQVGQTYHDYVTNCVSPYIANMGNGTAINLQNLNKMKGGHSHNLEEITFNLVGINQDFSLTPNRLGNAPVPQGSTLGSYGIVKDTDLPASGDQSSEWYFDIRAFGQVHNETDDGWSGIAGAGTGLVAREYQRLVEMDITRLYNLQHGTNLQPSLPGDCEFASDPALVGLKNCFDSTGAKLACPQAPSNPGHLCTGFEGMVVPSQASYTVVQGDPAGLSNWRDVVGFSGSVLKPGDHYLAFSENPVAFQKCAAVCGVNATYFYTGFDFGPFWDESLQWVTRVLGHGDLNNLPQDMADRRYFFRWFGVAMIKYLRAYGDVLAAGGDPTNHNQLNPLVVAAEPVDLETLFFDHGALDKFEYIDLSTIAGYGSNATATDPNKPFLQVPFDYEYGTDVKVANQRYTNWYKRMDREEFAMYQALSPNKSDPPGAHANYGVNLTNMFGSPVLAQAFKNYECAAAVWNNGWHADPEGLYAAAASDCTTVYPQGPPDWMLDLVNDPSGGTEVMDLNGQQATAETNAGYPANAPAYHSFAGGPTGTGAVHPLLWQYPAVWGGKTIFSQGHSSMQVCPPGAANCSDPKQSTSVTSVAIGAAQVVVPSFKDPWHACAQLVPGSPNTAGTCDPTSSTSVEQNIFTLVPWTPSQPGVGFTIPVNGQSDLMVQTNQLDFSGNLENYIVDYVPYADPALLSCAYAPQGAPNGGCNNGYTCQAGTCIAKDNTIEVRAIEAPDFLGEVFPCQDPTTGDVLHVRMYTSVADVLAWLTAHPGDPQNPSTGAGSAQTACGIIVRYSAFNNFPDFITSLTYGVTIATDPGLGLGRVVDAVLFNPVFETITQ